MTRNTNIGKFTSILLGLLMTASYAANAMDGKGEGSELTARRAKVARVLETFERNMNDYYARTGNPKRIFIAEEAPKGHPKPQERVADEKALAARAANLQAYAAQQKVLKTFYNKEKALKAPYNKVTLVAKFGLKGWEDHKLEAALYLNTLLGEKPTYHQIDSAWEFWQNRGRGNPPKQSSSCKQRITYINLPC